MKSLRNLPKWGYDMMYRIPEDTKVFGTFDSGNRKIWASDGVFVKLNFKYYEFEKEYSAYKIGRFDL